MQLGHRSGAVCLRQVARGEERGERREARRLDRGLVDTRGPEGRHLGLGTVGRSAGSGRLERLEQASQARQVLVVQLNEGVPARILARDRVVRQPRAVGVSVEVGARVDRRVEVLRVDACHASVVLDARPAGERELGLGRARPRVVAAGAGEVCEGSSHVPRSRRRVAWRSRTCGVIHGIDR